MSGPFFQRDSGQTFRQSVRRAMQGLAQEGEAMVKSQFPVRSGRSRAGVRGRAESLNGKQWFMTAVVSQTRVFPWQNKGKRGFAGRGEAVYRGGKLEAQRHMFRRTASALRRSRKVLHADLTRGLT